MNLTSKASTCACMYGVTFVHTSISRSGTSSLCTSAWILLWELLMGTSIIKIDSRTVLIQIMVAVANELLHYKTILVSCAVATQNFRQTKPSGLALF